MPVVTDHPTKCVSSPPSVPPNTTRFVHLEPDAAVRFFVDFEQIP